MPGAARWGTVSANSRRNVVRWRDSVPMALAVAAAHAGALGAVTLHSTTLQHLQDVTPPAITGVLMAEVSPTLAIPAPVPPRPHEPEVKPEPKPEPGPTVQSPPTAHSITIPEEAVPAPPPAPPSAAVPDALAETPSQAAPLVTPPIADADYLRNPAPVYPAMSLRRREQGQVLLEVLIRADGKAGGIRVKQTSGHAALDQSALEAVQRWNFVPARRGGEPIPYWYELPIDFSLTR